MNEKPKHPLAEEEFTRVLKGYLRIKSQDGAIKNLQAEVKELKQLLFGMGVFTIKCDNQCYLDIQGKDGGIVRIWKHGDMPSGLLGSRNLAIGGVSI